MALLNGVQQVANTLNKDSVVTIQAKAFAQRLLQLEVVKSTLALRGWAAALAATGIGAIVVALGFLASKFMETSEATKKSNQDIEDAAKMQKLLSDEIALTNKLRESEINLMEAAGASAKKTALAKIDLINDSINAKQKEIDKEQEEIDKLIDNRKNLIAAQQGVLDHLIETRSKKNKQNQIELNELNTNLQKQLNIISDFDKTEATKAKEKADKKIQIETELSNELENLQAQNIANEEARALKQLEIERSRARQQLVDKKASQALLDEFDIQSETKRAEITQQFQDKRDAKAKEENDKILANAKVVSDALQQARLDSIQNEFDRAQAELEIKRQAKEDELRLAGASNEEILAVNNAFYQQSVKISKDAEDQILNDKIANQQAWANVSATGFQALADLTNAFAGKSEAQQRKAFETTKKLNIAKTIIETFAAAQGE
jgi:hypothetical protein